MLHDNKKSILYVIPGIQISGGIYVILQHVNYLHAAGYDVALYNFDGCREITWFDNHVTIYTPEDLVKVISQRWDIVVATQFSTVQFVKDQTISERKIYFVQSDERRFALSQSDMARCIASYNIAGFEYMTEARWIARWLKAEFDYSAFYVPNGVDQNLFYQLSIDERESFDRLQPKKRKRVLLEGAINNPEKGVQDAYEAVKNLDVDIWIVSNGGKPPSHWKIDQFFENVPIAKMREIYGQCDVFLKMSRVEGFFGPPLEAMACGLPVVVGQCTGYDEYIIDGHNGYVVSTGDVQGAAQRVQHLLDDEEIGRSLVRSGLETSVHWSWKRSFATLESIFAGSARVEQVSVARADYDYQKVLQEAVGTFVIESEPVLIEAVVKRDAHVEEIQALLEQKKKQIDIMQGSTFWKMRNTYLKTKSLIFSASVEDDFDSQFINSNHGGEVAIVVNDDALISDTGVFSRSSETLIILVHFDAFGVVDPYFLHYLRALSLVGDVCVVSTCEQLALEAQEIILVYAKRLIVKKNVGYDFKAWSTGIAEHSYAHDYDRVVLTNDSIFGPLQDLSGIIDQMDRKDLDVWSMTDCFQRGRYHLQSYFMVYNRKPLRDQFLGSLFKDFSNVKTKDDIINAFEIGLSDQLDAQGYKYGAYASMKSIPQTIDKYLLSRFVYKEHVNPVHELWEYLLMYEQFPFLKRELVMKNPHNLDLSLLRSVINTYTDYDFSLIHQYTEKYVDKRISM